MRLVALVAILGLATGAATAAPVPVVMEMDPTLPDHTVYRPADLKGVKGRLPVVAWGNGACLNIGSRYRAFLEAVAAEGFLVVAGGPIDTSPPAPRDRSAALVQGKTEQMFATIDWAAKENARPGSAYRGRIDAGKVAVMGHSCGGLQAIAAGADPRVTTVAVLNSGIIRGGIPNPDGTTRQPAGYLPAGEADLAKLHAPMLYVAGGPTDQAHRGAEGDFAAIATLPVVFAELPVGHGGTWMQPGGGEMGAVVIDWLKWRLKGDAAAAKRFTGAACGLCADSRWTVKRKNLD